MTEYNNSLITSWMRSHCPQIVGTMEESVRQFGLDAHTKVDGHRVTMHIFHGGDKIGSINVVKLMSDIARDGDTFDFNLDDPTYRAGKIKEYMGSRTKVFEAISKSGCIRSMIDRLVDISDQCSNLRFVLIQHDNR